MITWRDKVVWITGASGGLGEAFARELAAEGCVMAISARRGDELHRIAADLNAKGGRVHPFPLDLRVGGDVARVSAEIASKLGVIDVLIANAGTHQPTDVSHFSTDEYRELFELNLFATLRCIEAVLPSMVARRSGQIVGVASVAGYRGLPKAAAYGASKAALTHFLESIRFDLEPFGIGVTVVNPGFVKTPLTDKNDFPMPFLMEAAPAARAMLRGVQSGQREVHFPKRFTWIMKTFRVLPYPLYHWLVRRAVYG